ncbi:FAD:protein FMN transferase [Marispirochaeta aestuarii]|uniref:FAD:protein FMN transferase n=1 Tax=Marispirochaeta aestuarii TaxID=1963862 RepID=UPI002ABD8C3D|nr:FAD:protein FMN transferase [Marispirochaeta aestuarii]
MSRVLSVRSLLAGLYILLIVSCGLEQSTRTEIDLLGTTCTVTVYARKPSPVLEKSFARIREIDRLMSYTGDESEVTAINRKAGDGGVSVSSSTLEVVERGLYFSKLGGGRFDITIGPLVELWGIGKENPGRVPSAEEIRDAVSRINYRRVRIEGERVALENPGMAIDLGGIAKGYAADKIVRILKDSGVKHALINLGGNVYAHGKKPDGSLWRIGVQNPESNRGSYLGVLTVADRAVVTSGPYERFFTLDGKRYHHILDPETGFPVENGLSSVTIVAENSMDADALSTLVFVLGVEKGLELVESLEGIEALLVTEEKKLFSSSGMESIFKLTNEEFSL